MARNGRKRPFISRKFWASGLTCFVGKLAGFILLIVLNSLACTASKPEDQQGSAPGGWQPANCKFPFTYKGSTYNACTYRDTTSAKAWCETTYGDYWDCDEGCPGV